MRTVRLYHPGELQVEQTVELTPTAFQHAVKVLRLAEQASVVLFNPDFGEFQGTLETVTKHRAWVKVTNLVRKTEPSQPELHLGQALVNTQKMDWIVQKTTELGVNSVTPLVTEYSQVKLPEERVAKRLEHWNQIAIHAAEQCERICPPAIHPPLTLLTWLQQPFAGSTILLHPKASQTLESFINSSPACPIRLLIGPEGGFSQQEVEQAQRANAHLTKLGDFILRTETAAILGVGFITLSMRRG